jgi:hypothetical protein
MTNLHEIATIIAFFALLGAFVDFYIGKAGQAKIRSTLETVWLQLSDVTIHNLVRREASFATLWMTRIFGSRVFSLKKFHIIFLFFAIILITVVYLEQWNPETREIGETQSSSEGLLFSLFLRVSLATYITIALTKTLSKTLNSNIVFNLLVIVILFIFQICVLTAPSYYHQPGVGFLNESIFINNWTHELLGWIFGSDRSFLENLITATILGSINDIISFIGVFTKGMLLALLNFSKSIASLLPWKSYCSTGVTELLANNRTFIDIVQTSSLCVDYITGYIRVLILAVFIVTLFSMPAIPFIMTMMLRVIESEKPVFTMIFAGLAAFVKSLQELAKLLPF